MFLMGNRKKVALNIYKTEKGKGKKREKKKKRKEKKTEDVIEKWEIEEENRKSESGIDDKGKGSEKRKK